MGLLDDKLPDLEEQVNATLTATSDLSEAFAEYRAKFFSENNLAASADPTAWAFIVKCSIISLYRLVQLDTVGMELAYRFR